MAATAYALAWLEYRGDAIVATKVGIFSERTPTVCDEKVRGCWALILQHDAATYDAAADLATYALRTYFPMLSTLLEVR